MSTNKILRINEDIRRVLSAKLPDINDPRVKESQSLISITAVDTTSDLRYAHVYLSALGLQSEKEFLRGLKSASGYLRRELGAALNLRYTPELVFTLDKSIERGARVSRILNELEDGNDS